MLNAIIAYMLMPFLPLFLYGNIASGIGSDAKTRESAVRQAEERVLGVTAEKPQQESLSQKDLMLLESISDKPLPVRKKDVKDIALWADSSVAIDVESGTILHYDNGRKQTQIASLTKMMTAILVIEKVKDLNEEVVITPEALNVVGTVVGCPTSVFCNANRMYKGEKVRAVDLLKAMLLNSANDSATALAIHTAGTPQKFVEMMNDKAKEMGLRDTHFCTPSGLEIDGREHECYSSAYDIARISAYSIRYDLIWEIMKIKEEQIYSADGRYMHQLKNTDILLSEMANCLGGKTGFTPLAGKSLLLASVDPTGKHKVISVVLNDEKRWDDMRILVNWIYGSYEWK